jgi:hypothetical protein
MDKKLEKLVNQLREVVSAFDDFQKSTYQEMQKLSDKPEKKILFHWDEIAEEMGVAGLNYGASKQLELMAEYFNKRSIINDEIIHYPVWDCRDNKMIVYPTPAHTYMNRNYFFSRQLMEKAYEYNRELFKLALAPK